MSVGVDSAAVAEPVIKDAPLNLAPRSASSLPLRLRIGEGSLGVQAPASAIQPVDLDSAKGGQGGLGR